MDTAASCQVMLLYVTAPDVATAERLASVLVEERLVACANLLPGMRSIYRWQGVVERSEEVAVLLKTTAGRVAAAQARVLELHPYDTPCVLVCPVSGGAPAFLAWITDAVRP